MLYLKEVISSGTCEVNIDYYVPFTINIDSKKMNARRICWRTGNLKKSLIEISIDEESGIVQEITLVSVDKVFSIDTKLESLNKCERGVPAFKVSGSIKNALSDYIKDFNVYLSEEFIMVKLDESTDIYRYIKLERVLFGINKEDRLVSIIIRNLSDNDYNELKASFKL